jgi:hypothetical protein
MSKFVVRCPSCQGEVHATRLSCGGCGTQLEGEFELPALLRLEPEELAFVTDFVRSSGSLKEVARRIGSSYPTVRARLDEVITRIAQIDRDVERRRHKILTDLEHGRLTAKAAADALRKVGL